MENESVLNTMISNIIPVTPRFPLGQVVETIGANEKIPPIDKTAALQRHVSADWGDVCEEDKQTNDDALIHGHRLLSAYQTASNEKFWIITEADRSVTTILLPSEY